MILQNVFESYQLWTFLNQNNASSAFALVVLILYPLTNVLGLLCHARQSVTTGYIPFMNLSIFAFFSVKSRQSFIHPSIESLKVTLVYNSLWQLKTLLMIKTYSPSLHRMPVATHVPPPLANYPLSPCSTNFLPSLHRMHITVLVQPSLATSHFTT